MAWKGAWTGMTALAERAGLSGRRMGLALILAATPVHALAQDARCKNHDPKSFEQVFACMSSFRYEKGAMKGRNVFENNIGTSSCKSIAIRYLQAVQGPGPMRGDETSRLLPSCAIFAQAVEAFTGKPAYWSACTNYPGKFDAGHMRACLTQFVPNYYGGSRAPGAVRGCQGILEDYERALLDASVSIEGRYMRNPLPPGYVRPDCETVADIFAATARQGRPALAQGPPLRAHFIRTASTSAWKQCLGYTPGGVVPHVSQCVGDEIARANDCRSLRQIYERKLQEAYGGAFPSDYITVPCSQLAGILEERRLVVAARAEALARANKPGPGVQTVQTGVTWLAILAAFMDFRAFFGHLTVMIAFLIVAWWMIRSGSWWPPVQNRRYIFSPQTRNLHGIIQLCLLGYGIVFSGPGWNWTWLVGAFAAGLAGVIITQIMFFFGLFGSARVIVVGEVGEAPPAPRTRAPRPPAPGQDGGWF